MELNSVWQNYCEASWPDDAGLYEGELMNLDNVITGCVRHYYTEKRLDARRIEILVECVNDLNRILPELPAGARAYFTRLRKLGALLLEAHSM